MLPPTFMLTGIMGFIISAIYTFSGKMQEWFAGWGENAGLSLGFAFCFIFLLMFISSLISMTPAPDYRERIKL